MFPISGSDAVSGNEGKLFQRRLKKRGLFVEKNASPPSATPMLAAHVPTPK